MINFTVHPCIYVIYIHPIYALYMHFLYPCHLTRSLGSASQASLKKINTITPHGRKYSNDRESTSFSFHGSKCWPAGQFCNIYIDQLTRSCNQLQPQTYSRTIIMQSRSLSQLEGYVARVPQSEKVPTRLGILY